MSNALTVVFHVVNTITDTVWARTATQENALLELAEITDDPYYIGKDDKFAFAIKQYSFTLEQYEDLTEGDLDFYFGNDIVDEYNFRTWVTPMIGEPFPSSH